MKIIASNSSHDAYFRVLDEMKKTLKQGGKLVVIAPDRFTASVERGLLLTLGEEGSFDIEVMSFTRMADKYVGADIKKCLTPEGSVMLIARVIDGCLERGELSYYGKAAGKEGFASELYAALTAIRNSGISSLELTKAASSAPSEALKRKLSDIVTVYNGYLAALEGRHSDSTTRLEQLAKFISENPSKFAGTHYFCTDIYEFSKPEYNVLAELDRCAGSLTIGIESGGDAPNARIYPDRVIKKLASLAEGRAQILSFKDESMSAALKEISERLFSYQPSPAPAENNGFVKLRVAKDRSDEVLRLALDVLNRVRAGGRFKDFEVYVGDISEYEAELKSILARYDIPFFIDKRALLVEQTKVRYLLDAVACVRSGLGQREVLDFVKNPLFEAATPGGQESVFKFDNYVLEHGVDRYLFNYDFDLKPQKKDFKCSKCDDKTPDLQISPQESVRRQLFEALSPLLCVSGADGKGRADISLFSQGARKLLADVAAQDRAHIEKLAELSSYYLKRVEQVDKKLSDVFDEIERVLDYETDVAGFEGVLKGMLKTLKISLVPTYLDCVFIGDGDSRFMGDSYIYILGATNDRLPSQGGSGTVLNVRDEEALLALGVPIEPNSRQKAYAEMFKALELIKKPRKGVVLSYPESGGDSLLRRSSVIDELMGLLVEDGEPLKVERIELSDASALSREDAISLLSTERGAGYRYVSSFGRAGLDDVLGTAYCCMSEDDKRYIKTRDLAPERIVMPEGSFSGRTSVSRLETFFACPYRHFMRYVLYLQKRREGELLGTENGTVLHAVLERFFKDVRDGKITDASEIRGAAERYFKEAIEEAGFGDLLLDPRAGRILLRTRDEGASVCEQLYAIYLRSQFKLFLLEGKIEDFASIELDAGGGKASLVGTIDRVDVCGDDFIVIDYKTFKSADITLDDVYFGKKLQLYIYMNAVEEGFGLSPAGVFYLPIYAKFDSEGTNRFTLKGHAPLDPELLARIDSRAGGEGSVVPIRLSYNKVDRRCNLTREEFHAVGEYARALAGAGAREIAAGYIKPSPAEKCSEYCDYYEICAFRDVAARKLGKCPPIDKLLDKAEENEATGEGGENNE